MARCTSASQVISRAVFGNTGKVSFGGSQKEYGVKMLVYFEVFDDIRFAIHREKRLKFYRRRWKIRLIESKNPQWRDLYETITAW
jgi:predicted GIY-YIG superfamily endonuclease